MIDRGTILAMLEAGDVGPLCDYLMDAGVADAHAEMVAAYQPLYETRDAEIAPLSAALQDAQRTFDAVRSLPIIGDRMARLGNEWQRMHCLLREAAGAHEKTIVAVTRCSRLVLEEMERRK